MSFWIWRMRYLSQYGVLSMLVSLLWPWTAYRLWTLYMYIAFGAQNSIKYFGKCMRSKCCLLRSQHSALLYFGRNFFDSQAMPFCHFKGCSVTGWMEMDLATCSRLFFFKVVTQRPLGCIVQMQQGQFFPRRESTQSNKAALLKNSHGRR